MNILVTTTVLNTKISEVENKIPDTRSLVTTDVPNTNNGESKNKIPDRFPEFSRFTAENFEAR